MKSKLLIGLGLIASIGGIAWWQFSSTTQEKQAESTPTYTVELRTILSSITGTGTVIPDNRVEIKSPIPGRIDQILVEEGDTVKRGQIVAWMSSVDRAVLIDQAREKGPAEVKKWEAMLRPTPLVAPITGTIINRAYEGGQTIVASDVLLVLSDQLTIQVQIDETDIGKVKLNQPVTIELDAYVDQKFTGKVSHIGYEAQVINNVTVYLVDVIPVAAPPEMRSGMTAYVTFITGSAKGKPTLPVEAIQTRNGKSMVTLQNAKGEYQRKPIIVGLSDGKYSEIISGIDVGTTVVVPQIRSRKNESSGNPLNPQMNRGNRRTRD